MSCETGYLTAHRNDEFGVLCLGIYSYISESLSGDGEGFAVGVAADGIIIVFGYIR